MSGMGGDKKRAWFGWYRVLQAVRMEGTKASG
jgi:hypothetical protein